MDVYRSASRAYAAVNLAGKLNDVALDSDNLVLGAVASRVALHRHRTDRSQRRQRAVTPPGLRARAGYAAGEVRDAATYLGSSVRATLAMQLAVQRSVPFFWSPGESLFSSVRGMGAAPLYPLAELFVGRGQSNAYPSFLLQSAPLPVFTAIGEAQHRYAHHGLAGYVLEAAPLKAAHQAHEAHKHVLAAACMLAAVVGRTLLQPVRLAVAGVALGNELTQSLFFMAVAAGIELTCRMVRFCLRTCHDAMGLPSAALQRVLSTVIDALVFVRSGFIVGFEAVGPQEHVMERDDGSPGVHNRVRARTNRLLRRFQDVETFPLDAQGNDDPRELRQAGQVAEQLADELRAYCQDLPSNEALRGGLALIDVFVQTTWGADAIGFHPPELAQGAQRAA